MNCGLESCIVYLAFGVLFCIDTYRDPLDTLLQNILVVSKYYSRITLTRLSELLCLTAQVLLLELIFVWNLLILCPRNFSRYA